MLGEKISNVENVLGKGEKKEKKTNKCLVLCMYVQPKMVKCQFFSFFPQQQFEQTIIFQSRGFEPYGMVSWPQGAVVAPPPPFPDFFFWRFCAFFKIIHVRLGKKRKNVSFLRVYVCVKAKLTFVSFFSFFCAVFPYRA